MKIEKSLEDRLTDLERKLQELAIQNETLDREIEGLLAFAEVTEEQLSAFVNNPEHFNDQNWQKLVEEKKRIDSKLTRELNNILNPAKSQQKRSDLNVPRHWLQVR